MSGANVTIVCGAVLLTAALVGPRVAVALAALALLAFVMVVQPSASVLRAAVMGGITLLAVASHRRRQAIPALSASVIALMIGAPELAVDVGFALSVSATAALVVIAPVWSRRLVGRGWPKPLADAVSVAVAAQLVTAPLVAGISGPFSVVSVAANLAVAAVIAPITVIGTAAAALSSALAGRRAAADPVHRTRVVVAAAGRALGRGRARVVACRSRPGCSGCSRSRPPRHRRSRCGGGGGSASG